jgi:hypothetical protein
MFQYDIVVRDLNLLVRELAQPEPLPLFLRPLSLLLFYLSKQICCKVRYFSTRVGGTHRNLSEGTELDILVRELDTLVRELAARMETVDILVRYCSTRVEYFSTRVGGTQKQRQIAEAEAAEACARENRVPLLPLLLLFVSLH